MRENLNSSKECISTPLMRDRLLILRRGVVTIGSNTWRAIGYASLATRGGALGPR